MLPNDRAAMADVRIEHEKRGGGRFNVLVTQDRPHAYWHWSYQLPRLLEPQGVAAFVARSGREAVSLAEKWQIHAAVIDLNTPLGAATPEEASEPPREAMPGASQAPNGSSSADDAEAQGHDVERFQTAPPPKSSQTVSSEDAGLWLLELFHRLPNRPPVVVVHNQTYNQRNVVRLLREALRLGAFSVLNKPVQMEQLLEVLQRLLEREYAGAWPRNPKPASDEN